MKPQTFDEECERIFETLSQSEIAATRDLQRRGLFEKIIWLPCEDGKCRTCWRCKKTHNANSKQPAQISFDLH